MNTTLFPSIVDSMIQMAECDISLSLSTRMDMMGDVVDKKFTLTPCSEVTSAMLYMPLTILSAQKKLTRKRKNCQY